MNNPTPFVAALASLLLLPGCGSGGAPAAQAPLAGARIGGPFTMTDQDGHAVSDRDFAGRYRILYFGYSYCPDVCPLDLQRLMQGYRAFAARAPARAARVQPIFVTVDPARDTPAVLKAYVGAFGPGLIGLTGSAPQLAAMAKRYAVVYAKQPAKDGAPYLMDHSRMATLFGPTGAPIALLPVDASADAVATELAKWVS